MKEIFTRTLYGAVFAVIVLGSVLLHPLVFFTVAGIAVIIALFEFSRLFYPAKKDGGGTVYYLGGISVYLVTALALLKIIDFQYLLLLISVPFLIIAFELFGKKDASWDRITVNLSAMLYIPVPFALMNGLFFVKPSGGHTSVILLSMFILIWANDVFAYLTGTFIGKHKLFERVSPKKTWEGSLGGVLFTVLFSVLFYNFTSLMELYQWIVYALIISVTATVGDLSESLLKRNKKVKDSGNLIPGHGGILDRFDATIFATPFVFLYFYFF